MDQIKEYHKQNAEMFNKLYPELQDIEIYYSRHDRYNDKGHKSITPIPKEGFLEGKYVRCSDENCTGKYNLSGYIKTAIESNSKEIEIKNNNCDGKLRGSRERYCERATSFWIKLIYK
jgi:hypothetical protein